MTDEPKNQAADEIFTTSSSVDLGMKASKSSRTQRVKEVMKMRTKKDKQRMAVAIIGFLVVLAIIITGSVLGAKAAKKKDDEGTDSGTTTTETPPTRPPIAWYRLPDDLDPLEYTVRLQPFVNGNFSIAGYVQVEMQVVRATNNITLHMKEIITHNDTVKVTSRPSSDGEETDLVVVKQEYDPEREFYIAHLEEDLQVGHLVVLSMSFTGYLNDQLRGFYRSSYISPEGETRWLGVTQFEADDARVAFPCMDEPAMKAKFTVTLGRETHMTSVSNMPLKSTEDMWLAASFFAPTHARGAFPCMDEPAMKARFKVWLARASHMSTLSNMPLMTSQPFEGQEGWVWDHFETTVPMSTYLVAFLVSDFGSKTDGNYTVWSREEVLDQTDRSLEVGPAILQYYEELFDIPYPLPKMDMVALPDFPAGAMENWGLITYREEDMLIAEGSSAANQQRVVVVVAHELAHQWFGNLVTPSWWTDIWLNEGFASFMENVGTDHMEPSWRVLEQMVLTMQYVMEADSLPSTHPVSQPVEHPDELGQIFDAISYSKGMSIIRMMNHFLTDDTFRKGITNYLNHFAYDSATQDDLWEFLTEAAVADNRLPEGVTIKDIMDTWTLQGGYPVVTVTRQNDGKAALITATRFLLAGNSSGEDVQDSWWVPISYTSADAPNFTQTLPQIWMSADIPSIILSPLPDSSHWVIFNIQGAGYYRVNYDDDSWGLISAQLDSDHQVIDMVTRSQLLDDALNLARAGQLNYEIPLNLVNYLNKEAEYVPWSSAMSGMSYLEEMLTRSGAYGDLRRYLLSLLEPLYNDMGFEDSPDDPHLDQYKRSLAVSWACKLGHEECVSKAVALFDSWMNSNDTIEISSNVKSTVYCMGVAEGGQEAWEGVWNRYLESEVAVEKTYFLRALGCSKEMWILAGYLDMAFTDGSGIRKQDSSTVFSSVAGNDISRTMAWNFLRNEWDRIGAYYDTFSSVGSLISSVTSEFNTHIEKRELEVFYEEHQETLTTASRAVQSALERTDANIAWMETNYEDIKTWLANNV